MIRHYGIPVKDLDKAISFYAKFYFLPVSYENTKINNSPAAICKLENGKGDVLELVQCKKAVPHISIAVTQMQFEILKDNHDAGLFEKEGVCYIQDDDGNILEIVQERGY